MTEPTPAPTHVLFTLKSGAEVHVPMPPAGMAGFVNMMEQAPTFENAIVTIWPGDVGVGKPDAIIVVQEIAAVQPSWGGLLDRVISYPRVTS